jgi:two-component system NtrC family response regulator
MEKLLIIDDNEDLRNQMKWGLGREYEILVAGTVAEGFTIFQKHRPKVVTLDLGLPPHENIPNEGLQCLEEFNRMNPFAKVIVITGNNDRAIAMQSVKLGAYDYYSKPIDIQELRITIKRALHLFDIEQENRRLHDDLAERTYEFFGIVGQCQAMLKVFSTMRKVASSDVSVLIEGQSGTGKELVARALHVMSIRKNGLFIPINCSAIPDNLLESELFGHEKGAFTGAHEQVPGKVEFAHGGTLFLDEIGELPGSLQVKLLRFLQEKTIQRVGGRDDILVDTRIIAATNLDIDVAMREGRFREDLYYRLGVVSIKLPPLRERGEDIELLSNLFLRRFSADFNKDIRGFRESAILWLKSYDWPGNVRELENRIQRAVLMSESSWIESRDLEVTEDLTQSLSRGHVATLKEAREKFEKEMITLAMKRRGFCIAKVASELGVSRPTLYGLIKKYDIDYSKKKFS